MKALVVGGGVIGLSVALELNNRGIHATVIERENTTGRASPAAAGMLAPQLECHAGSPLLQLALESRALYPDWVRRIEAQSQRQTGYVRCGALQLAFTAEQAESLERAVAWQKSQGLNAELTYAPRDVEPALTPRALAAAVLPDDHQVDPRMLLSALRAAAVRHSIELCAGQVQGLIERHGAIVGVDLGDRHLEADVTIVAAGAWSTHLKRAGIAAESVGPMRGQIVELKTPGPFSRHTFFGPGGYLVFRPDGTTLVGSTMENAGFEPACTREATARLLHMAAEVCPALQSAPVTGCWSGLRPWVSLDGLPLLGAGHLPGLIWASGHFRNGILLAPATAKVVADLVTQGVTHPAFTPFRYNRLPTAEPVWVKS